MLDYVRTWGDPASPTVVFFPGAGGTQWLWTPHAELLEEEYRVVSMDMPAHGVHPDSSFSFDRAIADVGEVLDEEGAAVLVGHSLGGRVAMEAASTHEGRVDGLLVAGVGASPGLLGGIQQVALSYAVQIGAHSTRVRERIDEHHGLDDDRQVPPDGLDTHDEVIAAARGMRGALFRDSLSALERYGGPTLLAYGEDEVDGEVAEAMANRVDARLRWYEGGHGVPSRKHGVFVEIVRELLTGVFDGDRATASDT